MNTAGLTEIAVEKVERNGQVAVLVSPGYGAGWSTWADHAEAAVYAPDVVAWIEAGKLGDTDAFEKYGYTGGLSDVEIQWLPKGTQFIIDECDGSESLTIIEPTLGYIA
jgi:hypothetical protein